MYSTRYTMEKGEDIVHSTSTVLYCSVREGTVSSAVGITASIKALAPPTPTTSLRGRKKKIPGIQKGGISTDQQKQGFAFTKTANFFATFSVKMSILLCNILIKNQNVFFCRTFPHTLPLVGLSDLSLVDRPQ